MTSTPRIQNVDLVAQESQNPYSYFTDELTEQVMTALQEKLGYTESQASNLLYAGGLSIYTTQDPDLQAIVDEEVNNRITMTWYTTPSITVFPSSMRMRPSPTILTRP